METGENPAALILTLRYHNPVAAFMFGAVKRLIGAAQQIIRVCPLTEAARPKDAVTLSAEPEGSAIGALTRLVRRRSITLRPSSGAASFSKSEILRRPAGKHHHVRASCG